MEVRFRVTRKRLALVAAAIAAVATGSIGWAAVGDDGTIQGCVTQNGNIDAIDPLTQACRDRQTQVQWYTKSGADTAFLGATAKAADADKLDGLDSTSFLGATAKAADADKLDGLDSTSFLGATAKAADADKLDGLDSTAFRASCPAGTAAVLHFCTETALRSPATYLGAEIACQAAGRTLPTPAEVLAARRLLAGLTATQTRVLTSDFVSNDEVKTPLLSTDVSNWGSSAPAFTQDTAYFCVTQPRQP